MKKYPKGEKKFSFFLNLFHIFPLQLRKKNKTTYFFRLFRETNDQKWSRKLPKGEKKNFLFFIIYLTFSLSFHGKKRNHLLFPPFVSTEIGKPQGKMSHEKIFFFFFFFFFFLLFCILPLLVIGKIATYLFFRHSDLKYPKMPLSALKFHILQITFFPP